MHRQLHLRGQSALLMASWCMACTTVHSSPTIPLSDGLKQVQARMQQSHLGLLLKDGDPVAGFGKAPCGRQASYTSSNNCNVQGLAAGACPAPGGIEPFDWCCLKACMRVSCSLHDVSQHDPFPDAACYPLSKFDLQKESRLPKLLQCRMWKRASLSLHMRTPSLLSSMPSGR